MNVKYDVRIDFDYIFIQIYNSTFNHVLAPVSGCQAISVVDNFIPTQYAGCTQVGAVWNIPTTISNTVTLTNAVCEGGCGIQGDTCNTASNILTGNDVTTCDTCVASGVEEVKMVLECPDANGGPNTFTQVNYMKAQSCSCA